MLANFSITRRKSVAADAASRRDLTEGDRHALPRRFEAVGEALVSGRTPAPACAVVGRALAHDGASLGEALDGLRATYERILSTTPDFEATEALSIAWSEGTLEYLHQLSCEDPLTGLASLAHVRTRLDEIYRETENDGVDVRTAHALVVVESNDGGTGALHDHFGHALLMAQLADALRTVFSGGETIGRVGSHRAMAVVRRRPDLGSAVAVLREYLEDLSLAGDVRIWIEGLPSTAESATRLLDDLAR